MSLRSSNTSVQQFFCIFSDNTSIFSMNLSMNNISVFTFHDRVRVYNKAFYHCYGTKFFTRFEHLIKFSIVQLVQSFVFHKQFERINTTLLAQNLHFLLHRFWPPCYSDMKTIIATNFTISPWSPFIIRFKQGLIFVWNHKINWGNERKINIFELLWSGDADSLSTYLWWSFPQRQQLLYLCRNHQQTPYHRKEVENAYVDQFRQELVIDPMRQLSSLHQVQRNPIRDRHIW